MTAATVENRVDQVLSPEENTELEGLIASILALLGFAITLTDDDRRGKLKLGDKSLAFVKAAFAAIVQFPALVPPIVDRQAFENDLILYEQLAPHLAVLAKALRMMEDTAMTAGGEAYKAALLTYGYLQSAEGLEPGLTPVLAELGKRFEKQGNRKPGKK